MTLKVLVSDKIFEEGLKLLEERGYKVFCICNKPKDQLAKRVCCSTGGVVDQEALYQALLSGKAKGAASDVFEEKPPKSKLLTLNNVIAKSNIGAQTNEDQLNASVQIVQRVIEELEKLSS